MLKKLTQIFLLAILSLGLLVSTTYAASYHNHAAAPMPMMSMTAPEWDGQSPFDKWFLDNMIPHHQQAVMMSRMLMMHSQRSEMKTLGNDIIQAQLQEIGQMQDWRAQWFNTQPLATHPGMMRDMTDMMKMEQSGMMKMTPGQMPGMMKMDVDLWFLDNMIPHHQGAIDMANMALKNSEHQEIITLAQSIITSQQKEITMMQQWKTAWYPPAQ